MGLRAGYGGISALVLGASGFIGRWVVRALCVGGAKVHAVVRDKATAEEIIARFGSVGDLYEADLQDPRNVERLLGQVCPHIIFNLAGYGVDRSERDEETAYAINAHLVEAVCEALHEAGDSQWPGQCLIHAGSALEYGDIGGNLSEDSVPNPTTFYGKSKLAGTRVLAHYGQVHGLRGMTVRLFTVYGPGEHAGRLLPSLMVTARTTEPLQLTAGLQRRDFTYVEDVAEGLLRLGLACADPGEVVNLATGRLMSVRSFTEIAGQILGIPDECLEFGAKPTRAEEMEHSPVTIARLRRLTGWLPPTGVSEGIRRTLAFHVSGEADRAGVRAHDVGWNRHAYLPR